MKNILCDSFICPQCASFNVVFSKKSKRYFCEDCGHELDDKPIAPMRIFLSYGHDDNEELVRRIKADLETRGHDVWFDKSEIKFGDEWRRTISDGIAGSHKFLSFLSKHSTRDPGVCRDEIAIAIGVKGGNIQTILVESEQDVQPPVNIGHIQWLDMHDWKDRRDAETGAWEQWYQDKFDEIIRVVESDESRRFAGEIETLRDLLTPIRSDARISQLLNRGYCGRQWLFDAVQKWRIEGMPHSHLFWIMGDPGVGKSAFSAQLTHTRSDAVIAAHFCEWDKPDHRDAARVIKSIAFQLATRLPDYRKLLLILPEIKNLSQKNAAELFDYLIANPLHSSINGCRERYLIVIDALDEAEVDGYNPLVDMLANNARYLPDWLGLLITSRPECDVKSALQSLNPFPFDAHSEFNSIDIRNYLRRELAAPLQKRPDADSLVEQILVKSEGMFLYVECFCEEIRRNRLSLDSPDSFPQGLGGMYVQYFKRQFADIDMFRKEVRPALRAILAAREPLPVEILQRLFNWRDEGLRDFTRPLASLFPVSVEAGCKVIKPYHKSLVDWLSSEAKAGAYYVSTREGDVMLARCFLSWWRDKLLLKPDSRCRQYAAIYLPVHLAGAQDEDGLVEVLSQSLQGDAELGLRQLDLLLDGLHGHQRTVSIDIVMERLKLLSRAIERVHMNAMEMATLCDGASNRIYLFRIQVTTMLADRYSHRDPKRALEMLKMADSFTNEARKNFRGDNPREIDNQRAVLLYKVHENLRNDGRSEEARHYLLDALALREQLAGTADSPQERRSQCSGMIWCWIGLTTFKNTTITEREMYDSRAVAILQDIERQGIEDRRAADVVGRLQAAVAATLAAAPGARPSERDALLERSIDAYRRVLEVSRGDRHVEYSLGSAQRYLAYSRLGSGDAAAAGIHLQEAEKTLAGLLEYEPDNSIYIRLDAWLLRLRSRIIINQGGDRSIAVDLMRRACSRMETAGSTLKNTLIQKEVFEFRAEFETLIAPSIH